ncbi:MAG TPA: ATP-dependent DNA ligase [Bryobacteraceae bacterium]|nr:ATP-dependent DNA ligase [Bryobacteraceae bacterium]
MKLPIRILFAPMEAGVAAEIPAGEEWQYEPKWDGFRCLAFRDGDEVELQSKAEKPLTRYFPELVDALRGLKAKQFVLDGEIIIPVDGEPSFDELLQRIHPAASRVKMLSEQHPGLFIVFDLLVNERGADLTQKLLEQRRRELERWAKKFLRGRGIVLSPATRDFQEAKAWFQQMRGSLDGVIAKRLDLPYEGGSREGMQKIKNRRTADCVIGGFRYGTGKKVVGSLLLGLYDDAGLLDHVGFTSAFAADERKEITRKVEALIEAPGFTGRAPGGPSRWSKRDMNDWKPLMPKLVVEVEYDHFTGHRFRHGTKLLRWRPDKAPRQCTLKQVEKETKSALSLLK